MNLILVKLGISGVLLSANISYRAIEKLSFSNFVLCFIDCFWSIWGLFTQFATLRCQLLWLELLLQRCWLVLTRLRLSHHGYILVWISTIAVVLNIILWLLTLYLIFCVWNYRSIYLINQIVIATWRGLLDRRETVLGEDLRGDQSWLETGHGALLTGAILIRSRRIVLHSFVITVDVMLASWLKVRSGLLVMMLQIYMNNLKILLSNQC